MRSAAAATATRRRPRSAAPVRTTRTASRPRTPELITLDRASEQFLTNFTPKPILVPAGTWNVIAAQVRDLTRRAKPGGAALTAKYARALARHLGARHDKGHRLDDEIDLFSDAVIASTLGPHSGLSKAVRSNEIAFLRRIRATLHPEQYATNKNLKVGQRNYKQPYSEAELVALLTWCRHSSKTISNRALATLLLGVACGLDAREAPAVRGDDLLRTPWGLVLRVNGVAGSKVRKARIIPIPERFEDEMLRLALRNKERPMVGRRGSRTDYSRLTKIIEKSPGVPRLSGSRARMYWVRQLIANRVPVLAMRDAGVPMEADNILIQASTDLQIELRDYIESVRGGSTPFTQTLRMQRLARFAPAYGQESA